MELFDESEIRGLIAGTKKVVVTTEDVVEDGAFDMSLLLSGNILKDDGSAKSSVEEFLQVRAQKVKVDEEHAVRVASLRKHEEVLQQNVVSRYAQLCVQEKETWGRIEKMVQKIDFFCGWKFKEEISNIFKVIFTKMCSVTKVLIPKKASATENAPAVVVGMFGFGTRYHLNSARLYSFGDLKNLYMMREELYVALKAQKMDRWAQKLKLFFDLLPDVMAMEKNSVDVSCVGICDVFDTYGQVKVSPDVMSIASSAGGYSGASSGLNVSFKRKDNDDGMVLVRPYARITRKFETWVDAVNFVCLMPYLPEYLGKLEALVNLTYDRAEHWRENVQLTFARELLLYGV